MQVQLIPPFLVALALIGLGVRLAARGFAERRVPEALLGLAFILGSGGVGLMAGTGAGFVPANEGMSSAHVAVTGGLILFTLFCQRVFRADDQRAQVLAALIIGFLGTSCFVLLSKVDFAARVDGTEQLTTAHFLVTSTRMLPFAWLMFETVIRHRALRRQLMIGLGDPVVANRFLLWSIWNSCLFGVPLIGIGLLMQGVAPESSPAFLLAVAPLGGACGVALWLSFFPPQLYRRWLRSGSHGVARSAAA